MTPGWSSSRCHPSCTGRKPGQPLGRRPRNPRAKTRPIGCCRAHLRPPRRQRRGPEQPCPPQSRPQTSQRSPAHPCNSGSPVSQWRRCRAPWQTASRQSNCGRTSCPHQSCRRPRPKTCHPGTPGTGHRWDPSPASWQPRSGPALPWPSDPQTRPSLLPTQRRRNRTSSPHGPCSARSASGSLRRRPCSSTIGRAPCSSTFHR
mmetsp:Transcript_54530/g.145610  ORF Transcript_54530/g.145610 Transcript_54530/m.145610 type:complete len:203 (+) Transcript_54530:561-1169(+)